jgi:hypothetical protein
MAGQEPASKRQKVDQESSVFHPTLFDPCNVDELRTKHDASSPYKHAVINQLFDPEFLNKARKEITEQLSFREKETDICESLAFPSFFPVLQLTYGPPRRQGKRTPKLVTPVVVNQRPLGPPADQPNRRPVQLVRPPRLGTRPPAHLAPTPQRPLRSRVPSLPPKSHRMWAPQRQQDRHVVRRVQSGLLPLEPRRCHRDEEDQLYPLPRPRRTRVETRGQSRLDRASLRVPLWGN